MYDDSDNDSVYLDDILTHGVEYTNKREKKKKSIKKKVPYELKDNKKPDIKQNLFRAVKAKQINKDYRTLQAEVRKLKQTGHVPHNTRLNQKKDQLVNVVLSALKKPSNVLDVHDGDDLVSDAITQGVSNKVIKKSGKYSLTIDIKIRITRVNRKGEVITEDRWDVIPKEVNIDKPTHLRHLVRFQIYKYFEEMNGTYDEFEYKLLSVDEPEVVLMTKLDLATVKNKQIRFLKYDILGDQQKVNIKNEGQCVIDYMVYEFQRTPRFTGITRQNIIKFFGEDCITEGLSTNDIIRFVSEKDLDVNVYALSPMLEVYKQHNVSFARCVLVFITNNQHLYPVVDPLMKRDIARKHRLELNKAMFKVNFNNDEYAIYTPEDNNYDYDLVQGKYTDKPVVLIDSGDDLSVLMQKVITETNTMVINMNFNQHKLSMFEHPVSKQVFISSENVYDRKFVLDTLFEDLATENYKFKNQTWTEIAQSYFKINHGSLMKSTYSPDYQTILRQFGISAHIVSHVAEGNYVNNAKSFDVCRCYTSILMDNKVNFNVFSAFDDIEVFTGSELHEGEYYIGCHFTIAGGSIVISRGWYPLVFVKYCVDKNYIKMSDLEYYIRPSRILPADTFKSFAEVFYKRFDVKEPINSFIGYLGQKKTTLTTGAITDDYMTALGTYWHESDKGRKARMQSFRGLHFVRSQKETVMNEGHLPIYRHIIASSYIKLDELHSKVCDADTIVLGYNTDSIKVVNPKKALVIPKHPVAGDVRREKKTILRGKYIGDLEPKAPYEYINSEWRISYEGNVEYEDIVNNLKEGCAMVQGIGGCGKTELIKRLATEKSVVLTFTRKAKNVLRDRGVLGQIYTFESFFGEHKHLQTTIDRVRGKVDCVFVDEFSMVPPYQYFLLSELKAKAGVRVCFFGDIQQCKPVDTFYYDYHNSKLIKELCNYRMYVLAYKFTRYDKPLYDVVASLLTDKRLPETCEGKQSKFCMTNISRLNSTRKKVNSQCFDVFRKNNEVFKVNGVEWCVNQPVICKVNNKFHDNSEMFTITKYDDEVVHLKYADSEDKTITVKKGNFNKSFDHAFCVTVYRYQGTTIREDFAIHDLHMMSINEFYTAVSRGVSLDKVHFNYTDKAFREEALTPKLRHIGCEAHITDGHIYMISCGSKTTVYIGCTVQSLQARFEQHRKNPPNMKLAEFLKDNNCTISLLQTTKCVDEKDLFALEWQYMEEYQNKGFTLLNSKKPKQHKAFEKFIIQEVKSKRFNIVDSVRESKYIISWREDGKKKNKKFAYKVSGKETAMMKAQQFQAELLTKFCM